MKEAAICLCLLLASGGCTPRKEPANTLYMPLPDKVKSLDPAFADDVYSGPEIGKTYEGLLQYHYLKRPYVLIPNLAESLPEISPDGKTYTFRLKKGVLFQDDPCFSNTGGKGRELIADDIVYSLKRLADPRLQSTGWWILDRKIVGLNEWRDEMAKAAATDFTKTVEGLKSLDRYTIQITLRQPSTSFLPALAMPFSYVVPREAVDKYGGEFGSHPVGTGPFVLAEYSPGIRLVWLRNPTHREELFPAEGAPGDAEAGLLADAGKTLPLVDRVVVQIFVEQQPQWLGFLAGKLDISNVPKENLDRVITRSKELSPEFSAKGLVLAKTPLLDVTYDAFNMSDPLLGTNRLLRQALSMAVDQNLFNELFFGGLAVPAQGPVPPGLDGYDPAFRNPNVAFNIARAKELLAKAGYPNGTGLPALEYVTDAKGTFRQMAEFFQRSFGAIGVSLKISAYSLPEFQAAKRNRRGQIFGGNSWNADYPDAENFLQLFYSKNVSPGPNDAGYANPDFDRLYEQSLIAKTPAERIGYYRKMVQLVADDSPWILHMHRQAYDLHYRWLRNYKRHVFENTRTKYLRVDASLRPPH